MMQKEVNPKEICFVTIAMKGGGTERVIAVLANRFANLQYRVKIMMIAGNEVQYQLDSRIQIISVAGPTGGNMVERINRIRKMREEFRNSKSMVIFSMGTVANLFTILSDVGLKNKIIISERNDPNRVNHKPITLPLKVFRNFLYHRANRIVFQTKEAATNFPGSLMKKSVVIPNPIPEGLPDVYVGERKKEVVTAGRLTLQKNQKMLINAFSKFVEIYPEYLLNIYGTGELQSELEEQIDILQLGDKVQLCGFASDLYEKIKASGIYVSCSDWEGISNSLVEALALGIPTIATDCPVGGSKMCIKDGENGLIIPMGDEEELFSKMCLIASNKKYAEDLSKNAIQIRQEYSEGKIVDLWRNL